jgi:hypothetical protein
MLGKYVLWVVGEGGWDCTHCLTPVDSIIVVFPRAVQPVEGIWWVRILLVVCWSIWGTGAMSEEDDRA